MITSSVEFCKHKDTKGTYGILFAVSALILACSVQGCALPSASPAVYSDPFREVHEAAALRDGARLMELTQSEDTLAAEAAWRALASTPSAQTHAVLDLALANGTDLAWFALSTRSLSADQLRVLEAHAFEHRFPRGLIRTLGLQGDDTTAVLLDSWSGNIQPGDNLEPVFALAMSRLALRLGGSAPSIDRLLDRAVQAPTPEAATSWLYALYRSNTLILDPVRAARLSESFGRFVTRGDYDVKRTVFRILSKARSIDALSMYSPAELRDADTRTAVDVLRSLPFYSDTGMEVKTEVMQLLEALLQHGNPLVVGEALGVVTQIKPEPSQIPLGRIEAVMQASRETDPRLYLTALYERLSMSPRLSSVDSSFVRGIAEQEPNLAVEALMILIYGRPASQVLAELGPFMQSDVHLLRMAAATVLNSFARSLPQVGAQTDAWVSVRDAMWKMLSQPNRSIFYTLIGALRLPEYRSDGDNQRVLDLLDAYRIPQDIEVYQAILPGLLQELGADGAALADSMANYDHSALNRVVVDFVSAPVREKLESFAAAPVLQGPDWTLLRKQGSVPTLQLETEAGLIVVEMDPIRAPSTVTAITRLAESGMYNGIPFHRIVPNFVIQGGDVETGDGFGGPDFVIPNEPSEESFERGAAGIASAGKDTEGSQFFFMIDQAPHLDGGYTRFGRVIAGMEVVERIRKGDKVIRARVSNL